MNRSESATFEIMGYQGFYDVPRTILAVDESGRCWVFDCPFDDDLDEYLPTYKVYEVKERILVVAQFLQQHCDHGRADGIEEVPVEALKFDATRRKSFSIQEPRFLKTN